MSTKTLEHSPRRQLCMGRLQWSKHVAGGWSNFLLHGVAYLVAITTSHLSSVRSWHRIFPIINPWVCSSTPFLTDPDCFVHFRLKCCASDAEDRLSLDIPRNITLVSEVDFFGQYGPLPRKMNGYIQTLISPLADPWWCSGHASDKNHSLDTANLSLHCVLRASIFLTGVPNDVRLLKHDI